MNILEKNNKNYFTRSIVRELLYLVKSSQFILVYTLNVIFVFLSVGSLLGLILVNSGDFFINIANYFLRLFEVPNGYYHWSGSLKSFFWYSYLAIIFIVYIIIKVITKHLDKRFDIESKITIKKRILLVPIVISLGYLVVIFNFSQIYDSWPLKVSSIVVLAIITILANYYWLVLNWGINKIIAKID